MIKDECLDYAVYLSNNEQTDLIILAAGTKERKKKEREICVYFYAFIKKEK